MHLPSPPSPSQQRGIALVVSLIFLLSLTLLGIAALSTTASDEKMNYAVADYTRAFQASESALQQGEDWLSQQPVIPIACQSSCGSSSLVWLLTSTPMFGTTDLLTSSWWGNNALSYSNSYSQDGSAPTARSGGSYAGLTRVAASPQYVIEQIGSDPTSSLVIGQEPTYKRWYFRISARGTGSRTQTAALSQSVYVHGF